MGIGQTMGVNGSGVCVCLPVVLMATTLVVGCGKSPSGGATSGTSSERPDLVADSPVIQSARIMPDPIALNRPVSVEVQMTSDREDDVSFRYQWLVDGHRLDGQTTPTLDASVLKRGQRVRVEIVPVAAASEGATYQTPEVMVGNTAPSISSVRLEPAAAHRNDRLQAAVEASDPDHDVLSFTYRWIRNQRLEQESQEAQLDTDGFQRGDVLVVEVTPFDGIIRGKPLASQPLVLANSPPKITSTPSLAIDSMKYQYIVKAVDDDGDFLTYMLVQGPPGMTIDRMTGHLVWPRPSESQTPHRVRVIVDDGHQGEAFQEFELNVTMAAVTPSKP